MKSLSIALILVISIGVFSTGIAAGVCSGGKDCIHCNIQRVSKTHSGAPVHGCCAGAKAEACDLKENSIPHPSFPCLPAFRDAARIPLGIPAAIQDATHWNPDLKRFSPKRFLKTPARSGPIYLQTLSLLI